MSRYFTKSLSALDPYTPGEQPQDQQYIKLNTNESPFPASPKAVAAITGQEVEKLRLYSDPACKDLIEAIAARNGISPRQVMVGNGSDEVLAFALRAFCDEDTPLAFSDITYGCYKVWCGLFGLPTRIIPLGEDFTVPLEAYSDLGCTIMLTNPNAPTGLCLTVEQIEQVVRANPGNVVIVDEAYIDFGGESCLPLIEKYDNLLVVQTYSKSRNLAGARLGFAMGCPALIEDLNRIKFSFNPYNVNRLTCLAGAAAMEDEAYFKQCTDTIKENREWTAKQLREMGFELTDSKTNFLFARSSRMGGEELYLALKKKGILVRHFNSPRIADRLRITVGSRSEMEALVAALKELGA
ncbi:MAG: histidinol-phosphate transaminase [Oscillospiraceae bacterium]|nr:histidinol-phosphate transaminase [Oscillospiraceae bacterium]